MSQQTAVIKALKSIAKNKMFTDNPDNVTLFMIFVKYGFIHEENKGVVTCSSHPRSSEIRILMGYDGYSVNVKDKLFFADHLHYNYLNMMHEDDTEETEYCIEIEKMLEHFNLARILLNIRHNLLSA